MPMCAQHGRCLAGASPAERRPSQSKRTAAAEGRPTVGRKRGAKPRADVQELDPRRRRAGRAGKEPRSSDGRGSGGVIRRSCGEGQRSYLGRSRLVPERATRKRSEKSAEVVVAVNGEGPNEEESETAVGLGRAGP